MLTPDECGVGSMSVKLFQNQSVADRLYLLSGTLPKDVLFITFLHMVVEEVRKP